MTHRTPPVNQSFGGCLIEASEGRQAGSGRARGRRGRSPDALGAEDQARPLRVGAEAHAVEPDQPRGHRARRRATCGERRAQDRKGAVTAAPPTQPVSPAGPAPLTLAQAAGLIPRHPDTTLRAPSSD